jgi:dihydroorotate dehydrogenase electron transfer subunit
VTGILLKRDQVAPGINILEFELARGGNGTPPPLPGQFYNIDCGGGREHLLRRPLSAHSASGFADGEPRLKFMVEEVGWGTRSLCSLMPESLVSMLGPLGRGFQVPNEGKPLLVAGGLGLAPIFFVAQELDRRRVDYDLLAGFSIGERYYRVLSDLYGNVEVFTEDGTVGRKGMVSEGVGGFLESGEYSAVLACGPDGMMEAVAGHVERAGVECQVSLVSRMACGIGACRGCVREGRRGNTICVCTDGPVFDSREVVWMSRRGVGGPIG